MADSRDRASRAYRYAHLYATEVNGDEDIEVAISDLMADLAHLAELDYDGGLERLQLATLHFTEEHEEEG